MGDAMMRTIIGVVKVAKIGLYSSFLCWRFWDVLFVELVNISPSLDRALAFAENLCHDKQLAVLRFPCPVSGSSHFELL
jgi:hypothetical protein